MRNNSPTAAIQPPQPPRRRGRTVKLPITDAELEALRRRLATGAASPGHARRIRVILLTAEGLGSAAVAHRNGLSLSQVSRVRERFRQGGVEGLADRQRPGRGHGLSPALVQRILALVASPPPQGLGRWSISRLALPLGISRSAIYKVLRAHGVAPYGRRARERGPGAPGGGT